MEDLQFDVTIIGGGMVGLSLSLSLEACGFKVALIETKSLNTHTPSETKKVTRRVSAINAASEKLLEDLGVWQDIFINGLGVYREMKVWDAKSAARLEITAKEFSLDALGYIIENDLISYHLAKKLQTSAVSIFDAVKIDAMTEVDELWRIDLSSKVRLLSSLIIGADGANSYTRDFFGFEFNSNTYQQSALVGTIKLEKPHNDTAYQRFFPNGVLALLPLQDAHMASIVYSQNTNDANETCSLEKDFFEAKLQQDFDHLFGEIELVSKRQIFPLLERHVKSYYQKGVTLVGDAAHTIHPLAGLGVNMGFQDVVSLTRVLAQAKRKGRFIRSIDTLDEYQRCRKLDNEMMLKSIKLIKVLFCNQNPVITLARSVGVNAVNKTKWLKQFFVYQARGK
ncbi:UbiH/UbiF/VisC/COQ6 family ubiquinone biosynthesis hydroxylase [Fangia hongkongensis]|uniref:UbiH/UbiF/VisC/COQ6 family ubiquinone biosynthesis hydroxylase n=1 Tax=Fangia hongkongensis TaxID=270495 RepID=UPI0003647110|nr:UbiH/UbiF/VisC/COQ6 family ubiquinone biosynthesis hydroxylase [Fangia hongkongensis]MBK2124639.1 UbiH/UbiF/VisC/COQ6 family ubiquinone biosynthesis hydroxylase [Fangia hongkongensis]